jgi:hypothetical protein
LVAQWENIMGRMSVIAKKQYLLQGTLMFLISSLVLEGKGAFSFRMDCGEEILLVLGGSTD